jgi:signal transduction histidine kinase
MQAILLISVVITLNVILIFLLVQKNKVISKQLILSLVIFNLSITSWQISLIIIRFLQDTDFLHRIAFAGALGAVYGAFNMSLLYPNRLVSSTKSKLIWLYGIINLGLIGLIFLTNIIIKGFDINTGAVLFGQVGNIFLIYLGLNLIAVIANFIGRYQTEKNSRFYFRYALLGIILYSFVALIFNLMFPAIFGVTGFSLLGSLAAIIPQVAIVYSLITTRPYTIKYILGSTGYVLLRAAIFYLVFYLVAIIESGFFESIFSKESYIVGVFIAIGFSIVTVYTEKLIKRYFESHIIYNNSLSPDSVRDELVKKIASELDINKIVSQIVTVLSENFEINGVGINIYEWETNKEISKYNSGLEVDADINNLKWTLTKLTELNRKVILNKESDLLSVENHEFNFLREFLDENKIEILISIYKPNEYFGYFALQSKKSEEPYTKEDIDLLKNINESLMLDISRSVLYKKVQDFNTLLNLRVEEATKELRESNIELADALKKEKDMVDVFSHELRTPAGTARNALQMIEMLAGQNLTPEDFSNKVKKYTKMGVENIRRLANIINRMLNASMLDSGILHLKPSQANLLELITKSYNEYLEKAKSKNLELKLQLPSTPVVMTIDVDVVKDIIDNLIDNAIKYTTIGSIDISVEVVENFVRLTVKDTGEGIPPEEIPKLGQMYYRVDNYLEGSGKNGMTLLRPNGPGIGLFTIKGFLSLMNGRLEIYSEGKGKGSTFIVHFPIKL